MLFCLNCCEQSLIGDCSRDYRCREAVANGFHNLSLDGEVLVREASNKFVGSV